MFNTLSKIFTSKFHPSKDRGLLEPEAKVKAQLFVFNFTIHYTWTRQAAGKQKRVFTNPNHLTETHATVCTGFNPTIHETFTKSIYVPYVACLSHIPYSHWCTCIILVNSQHNTTRSWLIYRRKSGRNNGSLNKQFVQSNVSTKYVDVASTEQYCVPYQYQRMWIFRLRCSLGMPCLVHWRNSWNPLQRKSYAKRVVLG